MDSRIVLNKVEQKWRSCNKLLPTIKLYPEDIIITVDDDIYYPDECVSTLMQQYIQTPDCIIAQEVNPIIISDDKSRVDFFNGIDIKLLQKEWGKYLTGCALFPPHVFDNTDIFDYDKMMEVTEGYHDEIWFWINSTLNGVMCVGLNYVLTFENEIITPWEDNEFKLSDINCNNNNVQKYNDRINELYGEKLLSKILSRNAEFTVSKDNIYAFIGNLSNIKRLYKSNFKIRLKNLTKGWTSLLYYHLSDKKL
jgi:hypothetical protein